jgi:hypothetical protein
LGDFRQICVKGGTKFLCGRRVPPELEQWLRSRRNAVLSAAKKATMLSKTTLRGGSNIMKLNNFARNIFQASDLDFLPTDKDGGFLIMTKSQKMDAFRSIANMKAKDGVLIYAPTSALEERFLLVPSVYRLIAKEIEEAEECEGLASILCNSLGTGKIAANLK